MSAMQAPDIPSSNFKRIHERRSLSITSNLVFSEWGRIFAYPMATAAIHRVVHRAVILEFGVPSYRNDAAQQQGQSAEVNRQD